ncbi:MAG: Cdc6-like AAA superfamily ATPase [Candidatus Binatia bacterium]|jgi:Cdc6-like AAA superfamily ATPase
MSAANETESELLTREEIGRLPDPCKGALVARSLMRVEPVSGLNGDFSFWGENALEHVRALHVGISRLAGESAHASVGNPIARRYFDIAADACGEAVKEAGILAESTLDHLVRASANGARDVAAVAEKALRFEALTAIEFSAVASREKSSAHMAALDDFNWLERRLLEKYERPPQLELFERPLWCGKSQPDGWGMVVSNWGRALDSLKSSIVSSYYEDHMRAIKGGGIDWGKARTEIDAWMAEREAKDAPPIETKKAAPRKKAAAKKKASKKKISKSTGSTAKKDVSGAGEGDGTGSGAGSADGAGEGDGTGRGAGTTGEGVGAEMLADEAQGFSHSSDYDGGRPSAIKDSPSEIDLLGRENLAATLAEMFDSEEQATPFTVALLGDWGAGKSSVMKLVKAQLNHAEKPSAVYDRNHEFVCAEFNAWEYEHTDNIRAGLAQEVVNGLTSGLGRWDKLKLSWEFARKENSGALYKSLAGLALAALPMIAAFGKGVFGLFYESGFRIPIELSTGAFVGVGVGVYFYKHLKSLLDHPMATELSTYLKLPSYGEHLGTIPVIKRHLKTLCGLRVGRQRDSGGPSAKPRRLIVFVDDLDRCGRKAITETLDAIRLVMDLDDVIVMLMIDYRIALKAVAEDYASLSDRRRNKFAIARDYLGKIVQLPIRLPSTEVGALEAFIDKRLFPQAGKASTGPLAPETEVEVEAADVDSEAGSRKESSEPIALDNEAFEYVPHRDEIDAKKARQNQAELKAEMRDTAADLKLFKELAQIFKFGNPRKLTRLRNSYRLLKGVALRKAQVSGESVDDRAAESTSARYMTALFWLEFLYDQDSIERARCKAWQAELAEPADAGISAESNRKAREDLKTIVDAAKTQLNKVFPKEPGGDGASSLEHAVEYVRGFVLPFHEGDEDFS